jgi:malate synthase
MVGVCSAAFTAVLGDRPNQLENLRQDVQVTAEQLLDVAATPGQVTEAGLRNNISVGIQYLASWLQGSGAVAIFNLMEDTATAEISRSQVWQWLHNDIVLADSAELVTKDLVERFVDEEIAKLPGEPGDYAQARATFVGRRHGRRLRGVSHAPGIRADALTRGCQDARRLSATGPR